MKVIGMEVPEKTATRPSEKNNVIYHSLKWWNGPEEKIRRAISAIRNGEIELLENI